MKMLVLLILINLPTGGQVINSTLEMPENACRAAMRAIWDGPNTTAYFERRRPISTLDADCVSLEEWNRRAEYLDEKEQ